jgi:hypothetical protein
MSTETHLARQFIAARNPNYPKLGVQTSELAVRGTPIGVTITYRTWDAAYGDRVHAFPVGQSEWDNGRMILEASYGLD